MRIKQFEFLSMLSDSVLSLSPAMHFHNIRNPSLALAELCHSIVLGLGVSNGRNERRGTRRVRGGSQPWPPAWLLHTLHKQMSDRLTDQHDSCLKSHRGVIFAPPPRGMVQMAKSAHAGRKWTNFGQSLHTLAEFGPHLANFGPSPANIDQVRRARPGGLQKPQRATNC